MRTLGKCSVNSQKLKSKALRREERPPLPRSGGRDRQSRLIRVWRTGPRDPARCAPVFCRCRCARCECTCFFLGNTPRLPVPAGTSREGAWGGVPWGPWAASADGPASLQLCGGPTPRAGGAGAWARPLRPARALRGPARGGGACRRPGAGAGAGRGLAFRERRLGNAALGPAGGLRRPGFARLGAAPRGPPCSASCTSSGASSR